MFLKRFCAVLAAAGLSAFPASAATVSFLVIETGLGEGFPVVESSNVWESGLMDVFFDAGHIVSNIPLMRLEGRPEQALPDEVRNEFEEAAAGGAEYFMLALLDFGGGSGGVPKPRNISLRLFRIHPYQLIVEQRWAGKASAPLSEEFSAAKEAARKIIPHLRDR
jgi:hypothetical protein